MTTQFLVRVAFEKFNEVCHHGLIFLKVKREGKNLEVFGVIFTLIETVCFFLFVHCCFQGVRKSSRA